MPLFESLQAWHWFVLGAVLLVIEVFGAGGFLVGIAAAAIVMSICVFVVDMPWEWQLILFAIDAVVFTFLYFRFFKHFNQATDKPLLNNRAAQLIGTRIILDETIVAQGSVQIGDTRWKIQCEGELNAGTQAKVTGYKGMTLLVAPA